jgi:hypothetical protein
MEPRTGLPNFWCTHIAKALVGEQPCMLQPWLAGRFVLPRTSSSSITEWKAAHSALLQTVIKERSDQGWRCKVEQFFRVTGQHGVVSGKVDLILQQKDKRPRIVDAKSGRPKDSDVTQVLIEMCLVPLAWSAPTMQFEGEVVYASGGGIVLEPREAESIKPRLFALVRQLATMERPNPSPSRDACLFCDVPDSECPDRWRDDMETVAQTAEF